MNYSYIQTKNILTPLHELKLIHIASFNNHYSFFVLFFVYVYITS